MGNISIFDFIGTENDDVYGKLQALQQGEEMRLKDYIVRLTDKFYELENDIEHIGFKTLDDCYRYLNSIQQRTRRK